MKKHLTKIIAFLCITTLFASMFVGCSGQKQENTADQQSGGDGDFGNGKLEVAVFEGGFGRAYWDAVKEKFEADYPGVEIDLIANPKIEELLRPRFVAGNPPDFIYLKNANLAKPYAKDGALLPLDDVFESKELDGDQKLEDKILDGFLEYCAPLEDRKLYYAPAYYSVMGLWYNKMYFEEKGWKAPETWEEFLAFGPLAKEEGKALFTYQGVYPGYNKQVLFSAIASHAGIDTLNNIFNYVPGQWSEEEVKDILKVYETIAQNDYLLEGTVAMNHTQAQTEFLNGNALFVPNGSWFESEMKDAIPEEGFSFGFFGPPVYKEGEQKYTAIKLEPYAIPAKAKNIELAKEFLKYQYTDEAVKLNAEKSKGVLAVKGAVELAKDYIPQSTYECFKVFDNGVLPFVVDGFKPQPKIEVDHNKTFLDSITALMTKSITVDEFAERLEKITVRYQEEFKKQ